MQTKKRKALSLHSEEQLNLAEIPHAAQPWGSCMLPSMLPLASAPSLRLLSV